MPHRLLITAVCLLLGGCGASTQRGETLYLQGRHIEAAEVFEYTEGRLADSPSEICACYGLYRGLNFLRLGDLRSARQWLGYAYSVERKTPGTLDIDERGLLDQGWKELESRSQAQASVPGPENRVAATAEAGAAPRTGPEANGKRSVAAE